MLSAWAKYGRVPAIALLGASAGCGGNVAYEADPDATPKCTQGLQATVSGEVDGIPITAVFNLAHAVLSRSQGHWAVEWMFAQQGTAVATGAVTGTGTGADGDEVETSVLFVTPQTPPFDGAIFTAMTRLRIAPPEVTRLSQLRRVGWCPGSPIDGEVTFCSDADCSVGAPEWGSALLVGRIENTRIEERAVLISTTSWLGDARATHVMSNGGLTLVERSAESSAGVIAFPETSGNKAVLCVEEIAGPLTAGGFHATALSLAGERPGEPVSGELTLSVCVN
jgi:hypothetical protein